ncbi:IS66 family transposase [Clostridium thailandense]|uniref:IS66 family transposase n=1 Tax=Clostridium thailandense TaxID=2794346 RepID=UPI001FE626DC|nr:transposase [Clostridium thailandense]
MASTTEDLVLWEQRIKEITKSGMSVSEWCKKNEISKYVPAKLIIKDYVQYDCGLNYTNPYDSIYSATVPAPVFTYSFASPSIVSWAMYQKYMMSVHLYRQEKDFKRMGAELKRYMIANWIIRSSEYWLKPILMLIQVTKRLKELHVAFVSAI